MSLKKTVEEICEGIVDVHVALVRARRHADILLQHVPNLREAHFDPLFQELANMQREIERIMKEAV